MRHNILENKYATFFSSSSAGHSYAGDNDSNFGNSFSGKKMKRYFRNSPYPPFLIVGAVILLFLFLARDGISGVFSSNATPGSGTNDKRVEIQKPKAVQAINREFTFPLKDQEGQEVSKLKYEIQSAELRDEVVIKGERATAVRGKTFLIVNLKVTNSFDKSIQVNVKDYVRLLSNNSQDKLAPDIHNDPVDVLAISTKLTRVGFPVNDTDTNLILQVGEIEGSKQLIKLNLK